MTPTSRRRYAAASLGAATIFLFVAAFAPLIDPSEKVPPSALGGMLLGLAGVALCVGVESVHSIWAFLGALAMVGAGEIVDMKTVVGLGLTRTQESSK